MKIQNRIKSRLGMVVALVALAMLTGCAATAPGKGYDYSAFEAARPRSILVMPPVNKTPEVLATPSMLARATVPLAESGYYVMPVALVNESLQQNGVSTPEEAHALPIEKLQEVFGADAVLYITVQDYGQRYYVIGSDSSVVADGSLVDLRSGEKLWAGAARASTAENRNQGGGLSGMLIGALINQISGTLRDQSFNTAQVASARLLTAGRPGGLLYGPRHPLAEKGKADTGDVKR